MNRLPRLRIAPINQLTVAMKNMVPTPLQFFSHRGFARAGTASY